MISSDMIIEYNIIKKLGEQGCFGEVFLAEDINIGRTIVVKEIPYFKISDKKNYFNESQKLYKSRHPNIAEIYYAGFKNKIYINPQEPTYNNQIIKHICLSMPYYENGSLEQKIKNNEIRDSQILSIFHNILQGGQSIHSKGLIHLDLKPDNILFNSKMKPIISDFGVSQYLNNHGYTEDPIMPLFLKSPESAKYLLTGNSNIESQQTDIYQLGILFYLMLNNQTFDSFKTEIINKISPNANQLNLLNIIKNGSIFNLNNLHQNQKIINIIKKMLHIDPTKRYQKILSILNDLSKL